MLRPSPSRAASSELPSWEADLGRYRLVFGAGAVERLGELTREAGGSRCLVVTDPGVRAAGHVDRALRSLDAAGVATALFDAVTAEPTARHVDELAAFAAPHAVDCIVAIGGGSAMDCAKGANFLLTSGGAMEDYRGAGKARAPMLPSIGVPTTAGSGSDAQSYALIVHDATRAKMACGDKKAMFRAVILDPTLAATVPRAVAATAGLDAAAHAVESHVSTRQSPISQAFSREAWRLVEAGLPLVLGEAPGLDAWGRMLVGAHLAGSAIEHSMLGAAHACANPLTARTSIAHGSAVALMLPHVVRFNRPEAGPLYDELQRAAGRSEPIEDRLVELCRIAGLAARLRDHGVERDSLSELAEEAARQWTAGFNPRPVGRAELLELYERAY